MRWSSNFTPELEKQDCKIHYNVDHLGKENVTVEVRDGKETLEKPWKQYLKDHVSESQHQMMTRNVLLATRNFQHRVESFRKEVIFGQNNPMRVRHISYRVEFQGRGAAHIHGVLWLDLKEIKVEGVNNMVLQESYNKLKHSQPLESYEKQALEKFTDTFVTCTRCVSVAGEEAVKTAEEVNWHGHSSSCKKGGARLCRWKFPRYPLERTIFVDANREDEDQRLPASEREEILDRVMRVLVQEEGGRKVLSDRVKEIMLEYKNVRKINGEEDENKSSESQEPGHHFMEGQTSRRSFPEDPCTQDEFPETPSPRHYYPEDLFSPHFDAKLSEDINSFQDGTTSNQSSLERQTSQHSFQEDPGSSHFDAKLSEDINSFQDGTTSNQSSLERQTSQQPPPEASSSQPLQEDLAKKKTKQPPSKDAEALKEKTKTKQNAVTYVKMESPEEYKRNIRERIDKVLKEASAGGTPVTYEMYEKAVIEQPRKGSEVLLQRDIDEIFINNYNPEWIVDWNANIDISPVYDYYGTITYITDYFTKVSSTI